jgi:DNA polymerase
VIAPPPTLDSLPRGTQLVAGLGVATIIPEIDFETFSEAGLYWNPTAQRWQGPPGAGMQRGLFAVGAHVYSADPSCELLCAAYDLKDGRGRRTWRPGMPPPTDLFEYLATGGPIEAWNRGFETWVWQHVCTPKYGWPPVAFEQWRCAMAKARAHALPGALAKAGEVLALTTVKDADGKRLLDKFSVPQNPTVADPRLRTPCVWTEADCAREQLALMDLGLTDRAAAKIVLADHADTVALAAYNETDIATEAEASSRIPDLSPDELTYWQDDQRINMRGVAIDVPTVHACIAIIEQATKRYGDELMALTGCKPTELAKLTGWLHGRGVHLDSLDEEAVSGALAGTLPDDARRALEIRAAVGSASVKKVYAMRNQVSAAGRLHDLYSYHAARTGRPTGNGPQPTNLPKAGPNVYRCECGRHHGAHTMTCHWCGLVTVRAPGSAAEWSPEAMFDAIEAIGHASLDWLEFVFGDAMLTIAGCLRGLFVARAS